MNQATLEKTKKLAEYFNNSTNPSPMALAEFAYSIMNMEWDEEKRTQFNRCNDPGYQPNRVAIESFWAIIEDINNL